MCPTTPSPAVLVHAVELPCQIIETLVSNRGQVGHLDRDLRERLTCVRTGLRWDVIVATGESDAHNAA